MLSKNLRKSVFVATLFIALPALATEPPKTPADFLISDPVTHSEIRDQGKTGFCWAYSTTAMLEAELLRERGIRTDLSEEYIGFFHIYEQLLKMAPQFFTMEKAAPEGQDSPRPGRDLLNGALVTFFFHPAEGAPDLNLGMDLIEKYGIVPESAFAFKSAKGFFASRIEGRVRRFINQTLRDPVKNKAFRKRKADGTYTTEPLARPMLEALARVYTNELDPSTPGKLAKTLLDVYRSGFAHDGITHDPKTFARDYLGFKRSDYQLLEVTPENEAERFALLRESLAQDRPVQLAFVLYADYSTAAKTTGILQNTLCEGKACPPAGGHAVLIVNEALSASTKRLDGFVIQNSWGAFGLDARGKTDGEKGFQIVTLDYLRRIYTLEKAQPQHRNWSFLLKR